MSNGPLRSFVSSATDVYFLPLLNCHKTTLGLNHTVIRCSTVFMSKALAIAATCSESAATWTARLVDEAILFLQPRFRSLETRQMIGSVLAGAAGTVLGVEVHRHGRTVGDHVNIRQIDPVSELRGKLIGAVAVHGDPSGIDAETDDARCIGPAAITALDDAGEGIAPDQVPGRRGTGTRRRCCRCQ